MTLETARLAAERAIAQERQEWDALLEIERLVSARRTHEKAAACINTKAARLNLTQLDLR